MLSVRLREALTPLTSPACHAQGDYVIEQMEMSRRGNQIISGRHPRTLFANKILGVLQAVRAEVEKAYQVLHAHCVKLVKKAKLEIGCLLGVSSVQATVTRFKPCVSRLSLISDFSYTLYHWHGLAIANASKCELPWRISARQTYSAR